MAHFLSKLFSKKSGSVVGIDIGSSSIKVVQLSKRGGQAILETYGELALGPYAGVEIGQATNLAPEKVSVALLDVMREAKVSTHSSGLAIPFSSSLIAAIEMPAVPDEKLAQMIPLEARKYIPVPITEVMLDWIVVPKENAHSTRQADGQASGGQAPDASKLDVLLVAIHNETLARYQQVVNQAALNTSFFEIEIFSTLRSAIDADTSSQMIVDMGAASTKVYIVERGIIRTSHIVTRGSQDITSALSKSLSMSLEDAEVMKRDFKRIPAGQEKSVNDIIALTLEPIFTDAHRVLLAYQKRYNKDVSKVVMVGGGARLENVLKIAESYFQTTVLLGDPFGKTEAPTFLEQILKNTGPEFAVAVGIALRKLQEVN